MTLARRSIDPEETAWVRACVAGDRAAFGPLVERYEDAILRLALRLLGDRAAAEDAAQDTFLKAYAALARYDVGRPFATWLFRIAVNTCIDRQRKRREHPLGDTEVADEASGGLRDLERQEIERCVQRALLKLSETYRVAVVLKDIEGLDYTAMSEILGASEGALKLRVIRGRERLADYIRKLYPDLIPPV